MKSNRVLRITPSATNELNGLVNDLKDQGVDVIGLNVGEPDFVTPKNIIDECCKALGEGKTKYCKVSGIMPLRKAICDKLKRDNNVTYDPKQIVVTTGAKQSLFNAVLTVVNPGDEVIIPTPCWVSYAEQVKLAEGVPVFVDTKPGTFALDVDAIEKACTPKTRAVIINTPNNPTGAVYDEESLRALGELAVKRDLYVISDEVYEKLVYKNAKHVCIASLSEEIYNHSIVINGFSKGYAMTGWRLGYTAAPVDIIKSMSQVQSHSTSCSTVFVQWAAVEALNGPQDSVEIMRKEFDRRREYLCKALNGLPGITCADADGAFYLMPDISYYYGKKTEAGEVIKDSSDFCNYVLKEAHVAIVPGKAFLAPNSARVAYSNSLENISKAIERMGAALAKLS